MEHHDGSLFASANSGNLKMEESHGSSGSQPNQNNVDDDSYFSSFPPGVRFKPTEDELLVQYLAKKIRNEPLPRNRIIDVELYKFHPQELSENMTQGEREWYFFTPRYRKYRNGDRPKRSASTGYWKATGADKVVCTDEGVQLGYRKALVFYEGKAPGGKKTKWMMHEYRIHDLPKRQRTGPDDMRLDDWVLCKIYENEKNEKVSSKRQVEESSDEQICLRRKQCRESSGPVEDANAEKPEIMVRQNDNDDAGGGFPVKEDGGELPAPFEKMQISNARGQGPYKAMHDQPTTFNYKVGMPPLSMSPTLDGRFQQLNNHHAGDYFDKFFNIDNSFPSRSSGLPPPFPFPDKTHNGLPPPFSDHNFPGLPQLQPPFPDENYPGLPPLQPSFPDKNYPGLPPLRPSFPDKNYPGLPPLQPSFPDKNYPGLPPLQPSFPDKNYPGLPPPL